MKEELLKLQKNSYSPYSKFRVSSLVVMKDDTIIEGVNVENASYGATCCAERNAIMSAITKGYKKGDFKKIYVMAGSKISTPCFLCRQVIQEFFDRDAKVICMSNTGKKKEYLVSDLCTAPFSEEDLL